MIKRVVRVIAVSQIMRRNGKSGLRGAIRLASILSSMNASGMTQLLQSLTPTSPEERALLASLIACAEKVRRGEAVGHFDPQSSRVLSSLSGESRTLFHGLVEAIDVYQAIHGETAEIEEAALPDLKKIRDLCLHDNLLGVY